MMKEQIAERLRIAREAAGFTDATDAAKWLGVPYPTYAGHENASRGLTVESAIQYARRYRVSLDWLLRGLGTGPGKGNDPLWAIFEALADQSVPEDVRTQVVSYAKGALDSRGIRTKETAATPAS